MYITATLCFTIINLLDYPVHLVIIWLTGSLIPRERVVYPPCLILVIMLITLKPLLLLLEMLRTFHNLSIGECKK